MKLTLHEFIEYVTAAQEAEWERFSVVCYLIHMANFKKKCKLSDYNPFAKAKEKQRQLERQRRNEQIFGKDAVFQSFINRFI